MTQISCPICGKYTPETSFLKPRQINDISGAYMHGLGRGQGFTVTKRYSLMNDTHVTSVITERCQRTINQITGTSTQPYDALLRNRDEWIKYAKGLKVQYDHLLNRSEGLEY